MSALKRLVNSEATLKWLFGWVSPLHSAEAFAEVYARAHLPVYRYLYGLHGGPAEDVEDLTAETFMRAWQARDRFEGDREAALGWLLKIARRLMIDAYRRRTVRGVNEPLDESAFAAPIGNSEEQVMVNEQMQALWNSLHTLPTDQREILVLRYLLGWRVNAIAEHLSLNENTVSVTLRRALAKLRAAWPSTEA